MHEKAFRDTVIGYLHFRANGSMEPITINATGVGSYDARHPIEAENFFSLVGGVKHDLRHSGGGDGFALGLRTDSEVLYPRVMHLPMANASATLVLRCGTSTLAGVDDSLRSVLQLEVLVAPSTDALLRSNSSSSRRLAGRCELPHATRSWAEYAELRCPLPFWSHSFTNAGATDLTLRLVALDADSNVDKEALRIDWFVFERH